MDSQADKRILEVPLPLGLFAVCRREQQKRESVSNKAEERPYIDGRLSSSISIFGFPPGPLRCPQARSHVEKVLHPPQTVLLARNQVFKHMSPWWTLHIQTTCYSPFSGCLIICIWPLEFFFSSFYAFQTHSLHYKRMTTSVSGTRLSRFVLCVPSTGLENHHLSMYPISFQQRTISRSQEQAIREHGYR